MDVADYLQEPQLDGFDKVVAGVQEPGFPIGGLTTAQLNVIENLVVHGDNDIAHGGSADVSAVYQIAIWSEEYGTGFSYDDIGVGGLVAADLAAAAGKNAPKGYSFDFLVPINPATSQTLITASPVPEPSTWSMLGVGFALTAPFPQAAFRLLHSSANPALRKPSSRVGKSKGRALDTI
jgi:hypothetical protein